MRLTQEQLDLLVKVWTEVLGPTTEYATPGSGNAYEAIRKVIHNIATKKVVWTLKEGDK